jgi:hypothetical protein
VGLDREEERERTLINYYLAISFVEEMLLDCVTCFGSVVKYF